MTQDEFLKKYHTYQTRSLEAAKKECVNVNKLIDKPHEVVVHEFSGLPYCLMLKTASDYVKELYKDEL